MKKKESERKTFNLYQYQLDVIEKCLNYCLKEDEAKTKLKKTGIEDVIEWMFQK